MKLANSINLVLKGSLSLLISVIGTMFLTEAAIAQSKSSCFMTDTSGAVIDLSDICNARSKRQPPVDSSENLNLVANTTIDESALVDDPTSATVHFVGNAAVPFTLVSSANSYYTGTQPVYVRRYQASPSFGTREASRNSLLLSGEIVSRDNSESPLITNVGRRLFTPARTPFIIYRYQK